MKSAEIKKLKAIVSLAALAVLGSLTSIPAVDAYPAAEFSECNRDHVLWNFEGSNWNGNDNIKDIVRAGITAVGQERGYDGEPVAWVEENVGQSSTGDTLKVYLDTSIAGFGEVRPSDCHLRLNPLAMDTNNQIWYKTVRHEMGHAIGMEHGGLSDNTSSPLAVMGSCVFPTGWTQDRPISKDQAQYANYLHNDAALLQYTANGGFETGIQFWGGNNMERAGSTLEHQGNRSIRLKGLAYAYNSYINQTMTVWDGAGTLNPLRTRYWMREATSTATTLTKSRISIRALSDDGVGQFCNTFYPFPGLQPNKPKFESGWIVIWDNSVSDVGTSWTQKFGNLSSLSGFPDLSSAEGHRIQAKFYGRSMSTSNQRLYFYADNVRLEGLS